ncbi:hypothetical protein GQ43DRAFT_48118 [Delitschia confertaspora ATCC 74209]|uniref:Uncharacterized protein n=1 Tax=Delitschia confertaspora ATCC 74209 TaxID=1513339 RepID=A0A9P4JKF5_9PLEO|nr:hypothetical protein GQ43DRAFT_48118 [Delitschia confertaspora ATCC 74209]
MQKKNRRFPPQIRAPNSFHYTINQYHPPNSPPPFATPDTHSYKSPMALSVTRSLHYYILSPTYHTSAMGSAWPILSSWPVSQVHAWVFRERDCTVLRCVRRERGWEGVRGLIGKWRSPIHASQTERRGDLQERHRRWRCGYPAA